MREAVRSTSKLLSVLAVLLLCYWMLPSSAHSQESVAIVQALQGEANASAAGQTNVTKLSKDSQIDPSSTVNTGVKSKLMLRWNQGMFTSIGESSSISLAGNGGRPMSSIQMNKGIARFTTDGKVTNPNFSYTVVTPAVSIQPDEAGQSVDYTLEVRDPATTILTVLLGTVRATVLTGSAREEASYESCRTVHFEPDKKPKVMTAYSVDLMRLINQTMIAGTLPALDTCPAGIASGPPSAESTVAQARTSGPED